MNWADIAIVRCNPAQTVQSRKNHFVQWGQPLGFDESGWIDRFESLEKGDWAQDDRYNTWALVPRSDPGTLDLLAHCETFQRQSIIKEAGSEVKEVVSYGVASVYTPASHRGKSYARQLLQLVHYLIAPKTSLPPFPSAWGPKPEMGPMNAAFSILFSGIGDKYYASCKQGEGASSKAGWIRQPITARTWDIKGEQSMGGSQEGWKWLGADDLGSLEAQTVQKMKGELGRAEGTSFVVLPSWSLLGIHASRSELSPASHKHPDRPYGLVLSETEAGSPPPFATFTYPEGLSDEPTLRITYLQHPMPFEAVAEAARKAGCSKVSMWGDRGGWDDRAPDMDKESEVPCYVIYGQVTEDYEWKEAELYTWC